MNIGILILRNSYTAPETISSKKLVKAARDRGHKVTKMLAKDLQMVYADYGMELYWKNKPVPDFDIIIVQPGFNEDVMMNAAFIKHFELLGYTVVNDYSAVIKVKNKVRMHQVFNHYHIPTPKTVVIRSQGYIYDAIEKIGSLPVIIKSIEGCAGKGVFIAENKRTLNPLVDFLIGEHFKSLIIQEYIAEAKGKDLRIFVVGKKVVGAMERIAQKGEFRSNFSIGGKIKLADITEEEQKIAIYTTQKIGLDYAGVDIIRTKDGPKVLEINANPGLGGITQASGVDVASFIVKRAEKKALRKKKEMITE